MQRLYSTLSRLQSSSTLATRYLDCSIVNFVDSFAKDAVTSAKDLFALRWTDIISHERSAELLVQFPQLAAALEQEASGTVAEAVADEAISSPLLGNPDASDVVVTLAHIEAPSAAASSASSATAASSAQPTVFSTLTPSEQGVVTMLAEAGFDIEAVCVAFIACGKDPDNTVSCLLAQSEGGSAPAPAPAPTPAPIPTPAISAAVPEATKVHRVRSVAPAKVVGTSGTSLEERFEMIKQINSDFNDCQDMINLCPDESSVYSLASLVCQFREYLFSKSKSDLFNNAFQRSQVAGSSFELTISRSRALKFSTRGDCDVEGRWSVFGQVFRAVHGMPASCLRRTDQLWKVLLAGERAQDAGGPYRESWSLMCQEMMSSSLPLFVPSPNAKASVGTNRETWVINPDSTTTTQLQMFEFVGMHNYCIHSLPYFVVV